MSALSQACDAAAAAEWGACLTALLAAWRSAKAPELAALIERVSPRATVEPCGATARAIRARLAAATDLDVAPLLEVILREVRTTPRLYTYAVLLAERHAPDPRIASALMELVKTPPFAGARTRPGALYGDVVRALHRVDDPRYRAAVIAAWTELETRRRYIRKHRAGLDALAEVARDLAARGPPTPIDGLGEAIAQIDHQLARSAASRGTRSAAGLLDAIYEDPFDDGLRLVYADAAQELGDPRGEFVALQCARGTSPVSGRERALLAAYARAWLGPIEPIVRKHGLVYRRGFPACARQSRRLDAHRPLLTAREWNTVEELDTDDFADVAVVLLTGKPALRRVWGVYVSVLRRLVAQVGQLPWTTLGLTSYEPNEMRALPFDALPALVELDLSRAHAPTGLAMLRGARHALRRLCLAIDPAHGGVVVPWFEQARASGIRELVLVPKYVFPGDPEGEAVRISGTHLTLVHHEAKLLGTYAATVIAQLPPGAIASVSIEAPSNARRDPRTWPALVAALDAHGIPPPALLA